MTTPPHPSSRSLPIPAVLIGLGVLVIIGYLVWSMTGGGDDSAVPAASSSAAVAWVDPTPTQTTAEPTESVAEPETPEPVAESAVAATTPAQATAAPVRSEADGDTIPEEAALVQLAAYAEGYDAIIPKNGQWAAQLSSKYVGVSDPLLTAANGSHTFYAADIVTEFEQLAQSMTSVQVVLLDSRDYGKRQLINGQNLWVTFGLSDSFTSEDDVLAWCAGEFPYLEGRERLNVCMPNRLRPPVG